MKNLITYFTYLAACATRSRSITPPGTLGEAMALMVRKLMVKPVGKFLSPLMLLLLLVARPTVLSAQVTFQSIDFESFTVGNGNLSSGFATLAYGPTSLNGFSFLSNDRIQGVLASSLLGTGKTGFLGGAGTDIALNSPSSPSSLVAELFPGDPSTNASTVAQVIGSANPVISFGLDFAIVRSSNANDQGFFFFFYDGQNASCSGFAAHSKIDIRSDNKVFLTDNDKSIYQVDTGVTLANNVAYHLTVTVNYNKATWSASISGGGNTYVLATDRAINVAGFTLSGYTTPTTGIVDIGLFATTSSTANAAFADRLVFDNLTITGAPEPVPPAPLYFSIRTKASPASKGTVSKSRSYLEGRKVTLIAKPKRGKIFLYWKEGRKIVSKKKTYAFTVTRARTLVAYFK